MSDISGKGGYEIASMCGQPNVLWDHAEGSFIYGADGRIYIDFTSAVLVANIGHSHPDVIDAIVQQARHGLLTSYIFENSPRTNLVQKIISLCPKPLDKVALFSTGSEAVECCLKAALTHAKETYGPKKNHIIGFLNGFHGRTVGAQLAGGIATQKEWIPVDSSCYLNAPYPDGLFCHDSSFDSFLNYLRNLEVHPAMVAAVIVESYQGGVVKLAPQEYIAKLRQWCDENEVVLIFDEVQSGFGRTGKLWGYEHYDIIPDLVACGKGLSCSLPISAAIGKADVLDIFEPGSMSTTHSGNPIACAAALAALNVLTNGPYMDNARRIQKVLKEFIDSLQTRWKDTIYHADAIGGVAGIMLTGKSVDIAKSIVSHAVKNGVLLFNPVGPWGTTIKMCPPLCINEAELRRGLDVLYRAFETAFAQSEK